MRMSRWLPVLVFMVVAAVVTIWTSGILNPPPPPDPAGVVPPATTNWVQAVLFGGFAGFVGGTLAWVAIRYPGRD
jgi:H+/Cl- antiporter ClcA